MAIPVADAVQAYRLASQSDKGSQPRTSEPTSTFAELVKSGYDATKQAGLEGEAKSVQAITGEASLPEVVQAVSKAEVTLQTLVSVRDRVIQAYQEVIRMPL